MTFSPGAQRGPVFTQEACELERRQAQAGDLLSTGQWAGGFRTWRPRVTKPGSPSFYHPTWANPGYRHEAARGP